MVIKMIKFTIILIAIYILSKGGGQLYIDGLSYTDKLRITFKHYTKFEHIVFTLIGVLNIVMWICVVVSSVMILFKFL